ncbi:hypothetical protein [Listeria phage LP-KV022]|uniref:Uncharacterized protein n=3 Tax=Homburgvirus TaxID=1921125 RepID=A0A6C0R0I6_9CAUD|nr:hypothetical protein LP110_089 [Listeria phage LP-110]AGI11592.1 hypothetical protein LP110_089 [Listeria phage LP-110]AWY07671.1 hypothetical protein [Listeria phage LP-KV022]QHZ59366.1 hypothetical protein FK483_0023 [Listeria phage LP-018]
MTSNYSILTNFGCHWTCPYYIVNDKISHRYEDFKGENK